MSALDLDDYLPYLLNRAGSRIAAAFSEAVRDYGISLQMWRVLAALQQQEAQRIGALSQMTSIEVSTLSRIVDTMEKQGLVARARSRDDARAVTVARSEAGRALTRTIIPLARHYEAMALKGFSAEEARRLKAMLHRLYANMAALEEEQRRSHDRRAG